MIQEPLKALEQADLKVIEHASEILKEHIYSTITLLALLTTLWQASDSFTPRAAFFSVLGTAIALILAIAIASRMSYHVIHRKKMGARGLARSIATRKALIAPAIPVLFFIALSWTGLISLNLALTISLVLLLLSFALYSIIAGLRIHTTWRDIVVSSLLEIGLGAGVIFLKILVVH